MPAISKKPVYIAKSLKALNDKVSVKDIDKQTSTIVALKRLIESNDKVYKEAQSSYDKGDEERAYILYMRYLETHKAISSARVLKTAPESESKFVRTLLSPIKLQGALERAEELSSSLKERYDLEEAKQIASKLSTIPNGISSTPKVNGETDKKDNSEDSKSVVKYQQEADDLSGDPSKCKTVSSIHLFGIMMGDESKLTGGSYISSIFNELFMVIDCRQQADYIESRIKLPPKCQNSGHVIIVNVPEEFLKPATVMNHIECSLSLEVRNLLKKRRNAKKVILMDYQSSEISPNSTLAVLFDALWKWDNSNDRIKQPPVLLKGGYEDWLHRYPQYTTNPAKLRTPSPSDSYKPKERIIPIHLDYDPNEEDKRSKPRPDSPIPSSPDLRSSLDARRSSSRTSSLSSSSTTSQQDPKTTLIFANGVGVNAGSRAINGAYDTSGSETDDQISAGRFGHQASKSVTGQVNEVRNRFESMMNSNRNPSTAPGGAKPLIDRATKPSIAGGQLNNSPAKPGLGSAIDEYDKETAINGMAINQHTPARGAPPSSSTRASSFSSSLPSSGPSSTVHNSIDAVSAEQTRLRKAREGEGAARLTHLDESQRREIELQRLRQTKPGSKVNGPSEHPDDSIMTASNRPQVSGSGMMPIRSGSPSKQVGLRGQPAGPSVIGRTATDEEVEDEEQDVHSSSKSASTVSSTLSTGGDEANLPYTQLRQSSPVPRRQHLHSESSVTPPSASGLRHQHSEITPAPGMLTAHRRSSLSRSHSSPNIAKLMADEMAADASQSRVMKSRSTVGGAPQFDRALKPINQVSSAKIRNFNPVYGTGESITGLRNLGNTCFMNAVIQCFVYSRDFAEYFAIERYQQDINRKSKYGSRGELTEELAALIKNMCTGQFKSLSPRDFKEKVDLHMSTFTGCEQQDSHEFLMMLLEKVHWDLNRITTPPQEIKDIPIPDDLPPHLALSRFWSNHTAKNQSIISTLFEGLLMSSLKCLTCTKMSTSFEVFTCLSLPIPTGSNRCTLEECFKHFSRPERLDGAWECPSCKTKRDAEKKFVICRLPRVLLIHLKRFSYDGMWRQKLQTFVDFPLSDLNLKPYIYHSVTDNQNGPNNPNNGTYELNGVVNHYGTLEGGHYTSFCRVGSGFERSAITLNGRKARNWVKFDDHEVTDISPVDVKTQGAYILFYSMS